ncbi:MAG: 1-acyl-sn-glycerol-3-phosphate acyltransferase [Chitinivibrionia bacterium]|nr:1-acyl-sn-glycerol-3-phosphate acyltransferase [Chitinivibrionia bacterium]
MKEKINDNKRKFSKTLTVKREKFVKFLNRTVADIIVLNEENVKDMPKGRMMVCCTHRSHIDYVILGLKIPEFGADQIRFAAGDNLTRVPMLGKLFRSVGAFSVYRGKASQRSYIMRLTNQVKLMVSSGDSVIVFPEAGRSYSGEMLDVKSGVLSAGVLAQKDEPDNPIYYLPCAINYTRIPDLQAFDLLLKGKSMRDNSKNFVLKFIGGFLYYFADINVFLSSWIFKAQTDVYLNVAKATPLKDITDVEKKFQAQAKSPIVANRDAINECSAWVEKQFWEIFPLLPVNVVGYLFNKSGRGYLNEKEVEKIMEKLKTAKLCTDAMNGFSAKEILKIGIKQLKKNGAIRGKFYISIKSKTRLAYFSAFINSALNKE